MTLLANKALLVVDAKNPSIEEMHAALDKFSTSIQMMTAGVANGAWHLLLMGDPGQGKTQTVVDTLNDKNANWTGIKGTTSAIGLYKFMFEHKDHDVIVIDDSDAIYDSTEATEILKAAMDSKTERKISWAKQNQNLTALGIPNSFVLNAKVILITNKDLEVAEGKNPSKAQRLMKPVVDRTPKLKTGLPTRTWEIEHFKLLHKRGEILAFGEANIDAQGQQEIMDFICENSEHFGSISFRTIVKTCAFYNEMPDMWQEMAMMTVA